MVFAYYMTALAEVIKEQALIFYKVSWDVISISVRKLEYSRLEGAVRSEKDFCSNSSFYSNLIEHESLFFLLSMCTVSEEAEEKINWAHFVIQLGAGFPSS